MSIIHFPDVILSNSHPVDSLPFVGKLSDGRMRDFWCIQPLGDYLQECMQGEVYAQAFIKYIFDHQDVYLLGCIVRAITHHQASTGIEIGFMAHISRTLLKSN